MGHPEKIAIVGAGIGGLAAAAVLSRRAEVTVFEAGPGPGGKIRQQDADGYAIDCGPTVFTMRWVFDSIFAAAGSSVEAQLALSPLETLARHYWPDGSVLDLYADIGASADAIAAFASPADADNYRAFCHEARRVYETLEASFLTRPKPDMLSLATAASPAALLSLKPFTTLWRHLEQRFGDQRLAQLFGRYATYCGCSPFEAPATLMLIAHVEQAGVWTLDGGMGALARALERVARKNGAEFRYNTPVERILVSGRRATGVGLADGTSHAAGSIVTNCDMAALASGAFGPDAAVAVSSQHGKSERSQSAMTWTLSARASGQPLSVHTVCFSNDYAAEFDAVFRHGRVPDQPTTYLFAPEAARMGDRDTAPPVFILINAPANGDTAAYGAEELERCFSSMTAQIAACGLVLDPVPGSLTATAPDTFARRFPATGGALFGPAGHSWRSPFLRPGVRSKLAGLYLTGGSVHPGPGVPMAALSGLASARALMADMALTYV